MDKRTWFCSPVTKWFVAKFMIKLDGSCIESQMVCYPHSYFTVGVEKCCVIVTVECVYMCSCLCVRVCVCAHPSVFFKAQDGGYTTVCRLSNLPMHVCVRAFLFFAVVVDPSSSFLGQGTLHRLSTPYSILTTLCQGKDRSVATGVCYGSFLFPFAGVKSAITIWEIIFVWP